MQELWQARPREEGLLGAQRRQLQVAMLEDDRRYFPPYECAVVVREETLARVAGLEQALGELSGKLPDAVMRRLNFAVDGEHRPPAQVAASFLDATFGKQR